MADFREIYTPFRPQWIIDKTDPDSFPLLAEHIGIINDRSLADIIPTIDTLASINLPDQGSGFLNRDNNGALTFRAFEFADFPDIPTSKVTSGVFDDARISADITRDVEIEPWAFISQDATAKNPTFNNVGVGGTLTVSGDLNVTGTTTTSHHVTLSVHDTEIVLNSDYPSNTAAVDNAGVRINRGLDTDAVLQWNELLDRFEWGLEGGEFTPLPNTNQFIPGGGRDGMVLTKASDTAYDVEWAYPPGRTAPDTPPAVTNLLTLLDTQTIRPDNNDSPALLADHVIESDKVYGISVTIEEGNRTDEPFLENSLQVFLGSEILSWQEYAITPGQRLTLVTTGRYGTININNIAAEPIARTTDNKLIITSRPNSLITTRLYEIPMFNTTLRTTTENAAGIAPSLTNPNSNTLSTHPIEANKIYGMVVETTFTGSNVTWEIINPMQLFFGSDILNWTTASNLSGRASTNGYLKFNIASADVIRLGYVASTNTLNCIPRRSVRSIIGFRLYEIGIALPSLVDNRNANIEHDVSRMSDIAFDPNKLYALKFSSGSRNNNTTELKLRTGSSIVNWTGAMLGTVPDNAFYVDAMLGIEDYFIFNSPSVGTDFFRLTQQEFFLGGDSSRPNRLTAWTDRLSSFDIPNFSIYDVVL